MEKSLTSREICDIVKACTKAGVKNFRLNGLHIAFFEQADAKLTQNITTTKNFDLPDMPETQLELPGTDLTSPRPKFSESEVDFLLAVEDPVAFEEQQLKDEPNDEA